MAPPYLIQPTPSPYAMQSALQSRNLLLQRLNSLPITMSSSSPRIIHLPPLSSKTTAQLLTKPSEQPYLQPLASEKMKSGTRSSSTASPPQPHSTLSSLRLRNSTQVPTSHALPDGSLQMPNVRTKQLLLWSSPLPAKTLQKKPSAEASHSLGRSSKSNATCPWALTPNAPNAWPLATTPPSASAPNPAIFAPWNTLHTSTPAADQIVLPRAKHVFTPPSNAATAANPTKPTTRSVPLTSWHTKQQLRGGTGLLRFHTCISLYLLGFRQVGGFLLLRGC